MTTPSHLTSAFIYLDRLTHNVQLLQELVGRRPLWPAIKANAYGHGLSGVADHLIKLGYTTLCVANVTEAISLHEAGLGANFILLSAMLPEHAEAIVTYGCEPAVCTLEMVEALAHTAEKLKTPVSIHLKVDTGMGRTGIPRQQVSPFLLHCSRFPWLKVRGIMSHFASADHRNKDLSRRQIQGFEKAVKDAKPHGIDYFHMANSAAILDLPDSYYDAVRPGIAIYGLPPSAEIINPKVKELKPILDWKTRITFLKEVQPGTGLSYGHTFHTSQPSLIATIPIGYGDGLNRRLSGVFEVLVHGTLCSQVGRITMDQSLIDVTSLRGTVQLNDEVVIIGSQGTEEVTASEMAAKLKTINYEVVTGITARVPRIIIAAE